MIDAVALIVALTLLLELERRVTARRRPAPKWRVSLHVDGEHVETLERPNLRVIQGGKR